MTEKVKPIRVRLDFSTLVFLMKKGTMHVETFEDGKPSVEIVLGKGEHVLDLSEAISRVEDEWQNNDMGEEEG